MVTGAAGRCSSWLAPVGAAVLLAGCGGGDTALLFESEQPDGRLWVLSVAPEAELADIDTLVPERLLQSPSRGYVYRDYRRFRVLEPVAVYEDGELLYHDPMYFAFPEAAAAAGPVVEPRVVQLPTRVGAICKDGWRSSATGSGACAGHGGVGRWRYAEAVDRGTVMATLCTDRRLHAGVAECRPDPRPVALLRLADWIEVSRSSRAPRHSGDLDPAVGQLVGLLDAWAGCDVTARVVRVPGLAHLPLDDERMAEYLPPSHRTWIGGLGLADPEPHRRVTGLDLAPYCGAQGDWTKSGPRRFDDEAPAVAARHFRGRTLEVVEGTGGISDGPYEFGFFWLVALDPEERLLYSFILNES